MYLPANVELRRMLQSLVKDPRPGWATRVEGKKERYEFEAFGVWVQYEIDETGMETVITATMIEQPSL
ncbi:MAG: hypothetical protein ETSY1_25485 [Candidatus Entotheonella factor]|uniref:Cytotoxic translational repressor of toxin-antitoxin stability system n=1 Tax=Entotheonella factor TaxID=1429438 RepID=W4LFM5_ENTF1|nr:MAG: hypothetical protein ETSY1_25485 [Candidatus Entotheonella factor]